MGDEVFGMPSGELFSERCQLSWVKIAIRQPSTVVGMEIACLGTVRGKNA